ncbi:hypothetical protein X943_000513 [Babesia divergens]|uniref:Uncharacterized protein n=1 Tax=Babesia divergens TaxID=32595 RepID=A0AAD9LDK9_BABDI|nr:hypothetical protein X943_000513 [Babesia divergens]
MSPNITTTDALEGVSDEDLKLIRHLTWLYGGYSMRSRDSTVSKQHTTEHDDKRKLNNQGNKKNSTLKTRNHRSTSNKRTKAGLKTHRKDQGVTINSLKHSNNKAYMEGMRTVLPNDSFMGEGDTSAAAACTHVDDNDKCVGMDITNDSNPVCSIEEDPFQVYYVRMEESLILDRRRPRWANGLALKDKIKKFIDNGVAMATEVCDGTPNTLSICSQFELSNHEAMVADVDRVHYYRAAIFWTGFKDIENDAAKGVWSTNIERNGETSTSNGQIEDTNSRLQCSESYQSTNVEYARTRCNSADDSSNKGNSYYCTNRRIMEVGTGPMCVLAMNALNAGAKYIDALEVSSSAARLAAKLMAAYGFIDKIKVFNCHSKNFFFDAASFFGMQIEDHPATSELELPNEPPYDMIISEILGDFCSQEGVADVFLDIQRRILFNKPEYIKKVKSIPTAAATMFVPCVFPDADNVVNKATVHEQTTIFTPTNKMLQSVGLRIDNLPLCEEWRPVEELRFEEWMQPQMCQHYESLFHISSSGPMCGFLVGIDVEIRPNEHFGTRFGHCESWYTNVLLFDREYQVYPGDLVISRSVANLTNYVTSNCMGDKIQVSRPSYSIRSYILSRIQSGSYMLEEDEVFTYEVTFESRKANCPCLPECAMKPVTAVPIKVLSELSVDAINSTCSEPEDWLQNYQWVRIGEDLYRVRLRPPVITIDYNEQTCATSTQVPSLRRKLPTDPPRRYKKVKTKAEGDNSVASRKSA